VRTLILLLAAAFAFESRASDRIVSAGGAITETIYALGAQDALVAVDTSSIYPEQAAALPKVGYSRALSAEGILSVKPSLVLVNGDSGPAEALNQVEKIGVKVVRLPNEHTVEAAENRIRVVGSEVGRAEAADKLIAALREDLKAASESAGNPETAPKVLFIYTRGGGLMNVSGKNTAADAMIALAGARNAVTDYEGYKPLTAEAAVAAAPDVILVTSKGLESAGGVDELLKQPGLALTPAGKARRVVALDDLYLLGFGPRLGKAALELGQKLRASPGLALK